MGIYIKKGLHTLRQKIRARTTYINNLSKVSDETKKLYVELVKPIIDVYNPVVSPLIKQKSNIFYRARKCKNNQPFNDIEQLYNPPSPSGRAITYSSRPILYGASSMQTALVEIDAKIGELICIADFDYSKIINGHFWFVGQLGMYYKNPESVRYVRDMNTVQNPFYASGEALDSLVYTDLLINEVFSELSSNKDDHLLNQLLIEGIEKSIPNSKIFSGVLFNSTKAAPGMNFAIYANAINSLVIKSVHLIEVVNIDDYGCINHKLLDNSFPKEGKLNWRWNE